MARLYRLILDDFSAASFTSFSKNYFGTLEQLKGLFDDMRSDKKTAERFSDILSVFDRYLAGEKNLTHNVAYREVPFLVQAKVLGTATSELTDYKWTHFNTWEWPYYMKCKKAVSTHIWVSCHGEYFRCILTQFTNLRYNTSEKDYKPLGGMIWGYPGQIIHFDEDGEITRIEDYNLENIKIPDYAYESIARVLLPDIQEYFASEEGQKALAELEAKKRKCKK